MRTRVEGRDVNVLNGVYGGQFLSSPSPVGQPAKVTVEECE